MTDGNSYFVWGSTLVIAVTAFVIALNWLSLIAFIVKKSKGNFSFAPPFICGILGAFASLLALEHHALWVAIGFLLLDPSIGLALGSIGIKKWLAKPSQQE
jgi:hypothetical protein